MLEAEACGGLLAMVAALYVAQVEAQSPTVSELIEKGHVKEEEIGGILRSQQDENIMGAVRKDDPEMVARVLANSEDPAADIEMVGGDLKTLLMYATIWGKGKEKVIPKLIEIGVPLDAVDDIALLHKTGGGSLQRSAGNSCTKSLPQVLPRYWVLPCCLWDIGPHGLPSKFIGHDTSLGRYHTYAQS